MACLPKSDGVIGSPANKEAEHQGTSQPDGLKFGKLLPHLSFIILDLLGLPVDHDDDGDVAGHHDQEGDDIGHAYHVQEIQKFLCKIKFPDCEKNLLMHIPCLEM